MYRLFRNGSYAKRGRKRSNEGANTSQTVYHPRWQFPQHLNEDPSKAPGNVHCGDCGGPLPLSTPAATRSITNLWIDEDRLLLSWRFRARVW